MKSLNASIKNHMRLLQSGNSEMNKLKGNLSEPVPGNKESTVVNNNKLPDRVYSVPALIPKMPPFITNSKTYKSKMIILSTVALASFLSIVSVGWLETKFKKVQKPEPLNITATRPEQNQDVNTIPVKANVLIENPKMEEYKAHWKKYITATHSNYAYGVLGGIKDLSVELSNKTAYTLDQVTVKVTYIKANGKPWKSKLVEVFNMPPWSVRNQSLSTVNRGKSVTVSIYKIISRKMNFKYTGI